MQHTELLHKILQESQAVKHKTRLNSLMSVVSSVLKGSALSLTSLGRHMPKEIKPRSRIQEVNYLLSNGHLQGERLGIYAAINRWMIGDEKLVFIAIDWSSVVAHEQHVLRASMLRKGRSITVYEEIHAEKELGHAEVHQAFLTHLKSVLPDGCEVCLIVDAGFRTDFYMQVETNDWGYVGRLLSTMYYSPREEENWRWCPELYEQASSQPETIGAVMLTKSRRCQSHLYLYKRLEAQAHREGKSLRKIKHGKKEKEYKNAAKKPWLIASSLAISAEKIMAIYRKRMKIEHDFRDSKDPRWGLGLRESRSKDPSRLTLQLLIGFLASFLLWLIGLCLEKKELHRDFQANSIRHKRVLSLIFLALEAIKNNYMRFIGESDFWELKREGLQDEILSEQYLC